MADLCETGGEIYNEGCLSDTSFVVNKTDLSSHREALGLKRLSAKSFPLFGSATMVNDACSPFDGFLCILTAV